MRIENIKIADCVHYRSFRYGGFGHNIYEDYAVGLYHGVNLALLRNTLKSRVLAHEATDFAATLNISLKSKYAPWTFPWNLATIVNFKPRVFLPENNPDIICHYAAEGVLASHINREYAWLERAFIEMKSGYDPLHNSFIKVRRFESTTSVRFLVLDGNHRISALHALGVSTVPCQIIGSTLTDRSAKTWPGVLARRYTLEDALAVFNSYFRSTNPELSKIGRQIVIYDEPLLL